MGIGTSIFLIALGAILRFAVTATVSGISIATVGTILLIVGIVGLLISLLYAFNLSAFVMEAAWLAVRIYGIARGRRRLRR